ncbi:uncharacterized protein BDR25DRAFT_311366 [Lindgomyces ingoldianus]|uniref:Uncharacterized protein n=1 Tax=Lindgomyces ingoldianus TaxID=673940 RepID=A0ACB6R744_9PLEO|nr:uncharacterized protein BDR25DRAFT_311366 [Lindgomyces ingoldianus]KAF2474986.1 hypothetical protein BDR25DRAFT_311366 [Lindgomyces ingoldianus]
MSDNVPLDAQQSISAVLDHFGWDSYWDLYLQADVEPAGGFCPVSIGRTALNDETPSSAFWLLHDSQQAPQLLSSPLGSFEAGQSSREPPQHTGLPGMVGEPFQHSRMNVIPPSLCDGFADEPNHIAQPRFWISERERGQATTNALNLTCAQFSLLVSQQSDSGSCSAISGSFPWIIQASNIDLLKCSFPNYKNKTKFKRAIDLKRHEKKHSRSERYECTAGILYAV